ncbi:MAG: hypothetical protein JJE02_06110, partial [Propionibacteriales bacterium]|nr:hypothetical protein [Propionibacteriales bacterium]
MRRLVRKSMGISAAAVLAGVAMSMPTDTANASPDPASIQPFLANQLTNLSNSAPTTVLVHGESLAAANNAVEASGLT